MSRNVRRSKWSRQLIATVVILGAAATGCAQNDPPPIAQPVTTTQPPREVAEPETTTTTTATTTTVEPSTPSTISVSVLGSIRSLPTDDPENSAGSAAADADAARSTRDTNDATIASLGCTESSGCEATDLAAWAANNIDAVNLATSAAAADGADVLDEYSAALIASGVSTIGYGPTLPEALIPAIVGGADRPVAIYGISLDENLSPDLVASDIGPGVAAGEEALDLLLEQIARSQDADQHVVVMMDFGRLEDRAPAPLELEQVQVVVDAGVDAIVGHGSDFLQRFERIDQTAVAFSLGNAVTDTDVELRRDTAIFRLNFEEGRPIACLLPASGGASGVTLDDPTTPDCP